MNITNLQFPVKKQNLLLVFLLLLVSGNPAIKFIGMWGLLLVFLLIIKHKSIVYNKYLTTSIIYLLVIFICQQFILGFVSWFGAFNFIVKLLVGYIIVQTVNTQFRYAYLKIFYFLGIISLFFFSLNLFGYVIPDFFTGTEYHSIGLYTQLVFETSEGRIRNSGMFWEPGAYAGYIMLIPLMFLNSLKLLWKNYKKESIIILLSLISTQSTTGILCLMVFIFLYIIFIQHNKFLSYSILLPIILILTVYAFNEFDFLGEKISKQASEAQVRKETGEFEGGRFSALIFDLKYIKKHPIIGNGFHESTRYADDPEVGTGELGQNGNGFSSFTASMGLTTILLYILLIFKYSIFNSKEKIIFIIIVILLLQGEGFLNYPMFLSLPFIIYSTNRNINALGQLKHT